MPVSVNDDLDGHYCFGCGRHNPIGLHLRFHLDEPDQPGAAEPGPDIRGVIARYEPRREDQGFPGVMHGGLLVTLLDEAMAWAMFAAGRGFGVTAKMETRYRNAARLDGSLTVRARVVRIRGRRIEVAGAVTSAEGTRLVEADALFLRLPPERETEMVALLGRELEDEGRALEG